MTTPVYQRHGITVHAGDCLDVLRTLPDASVHAIVTDPPYGLEFMSKSWDTFGKPSNARLRTRVDDRTNPTSGKSVTTTPEAYVAGHPFQQWCETWARECLRVLKPGGHLLAFGGTRTYHRLTCGIEDAGFEIRDGMQWLYGSGFPKSLDVSKAIDKARDDHADVLRVTGWLAEQRDRAGLTNREIDEAFGFHGMAGHWTAAPRLKIAQVPRWEQWSKLRELIGFGDGMDAEVWRLNGRKGTPGEAWQTAEVLRTENRFNEPSGVVGVGQGERIAVTRSIKVANTDAAREWEGWGTALKPAHEPIVVARKPLIGTVAANVIEHGAGGLNIDATRVRTASAADEAAYKAKCASVVGLDSNRNGAAYGEWTGQRADSASAQGRWPANVVLVHGPECGEVCQDGCPIVELDAQSGTSTSSDRLRKNTAAAHNATASMGKFKADWTTDGHSGGASRFFPTFRWEPKAPASERPKVAGKAHATVKPLALMRWLVRLVTPPGGTVLDPFCGSGTTLHAARAEGFRAIGIDNDPDSVVWTVSRLDGYREPVVVDEGAGRPEPVDLLDLLDGGDAA